MKNLFARRLVRSPALLLCAAVLFSCFVQAAFAYPADVEALLNAAPLTPVYSNDEDVDRMVAEVLAEQTTPRMTTAEKVLALYDYCIANYTYAKPDYYHSWLYYDAYKSRTDAWTVCCAAYILKYHVGVCDHYSAAYTLMLRAIGLEAYHVRGTVIGDDHMWTVVRLNGALYTFDPEVDYKNQTKRGSHVYLFYGMPDSVSPKYYGNGERQACINDYGGFARTDGKQAEPPAPQIPATEITDILSSAPVVSVSCSARFLIFCSGGAESGGSYTVILSDTTDAAAAITERDGAFLWTPRTEGTHLLRFSAAGEDGSRDDKEFTVEVRSASVLNGKNDACGAVPVPPDETAGSLAADFFAGQKVAFLLPNGEPAAPDATAAGLTVRLDASDDKATLVAGCDADGNGKITSADARLALRAAARLQTITDPLRFACTDLNRDGKITTADARGILRAAARVIPAAYVSVI
ncbi:MAG: hypothetical protein IK118_04835 [Clostridia bacterium]|nr:hypothetical protein [Clostridia bacterium]